MNDAALSCKEAVNLFAIVQETYKYFSASSHRWSVLKKHVTSLTLKPLCETRWESRIDAIQPFRYQIGELYDALYECSVNAKIDGYGQNAATGLARKLKSFKFLCCLVVWNYILFRINLISKMFQKVEMNISEAGELTTKIRDHFQKMRSEKGFEEMIVDAVEMADIIETEPVFSTEIEIRPRKHTRQFDYESAGNVVLDSKEAFKINFFFCILDQTLSSLEERFFQLNAHNDIFGFVYNLTSIETYSNEKNDILKKCSDLQIALTDRASSDIDGLQLYQELSVLLSLLPAKCPKGPFEMLKYLTTNSLCENFPNVVIVLRITLTLPVSVANGERSFSKLKLIKNYLRSTMPRERLVGLAMMSIEFNVLQDIDTQTIIKDFSEKKARKVLF